MRKPRTATNRRWNKWLENNNNSNKCWYYDGISKYGNAITECRCPWEKKCNGNVFECSKLRYKYFASIKK